MKVMFGTSVCHNKLAIKLEGNASNPAMVWNAPKTANSAHFVPKHPLDHFFVKGVINSLGYIISYDITSYDYFRTGDIFIYF